MTDETITITAREAARRRMPLDGADAQALEGALAMTERELDAEREIREAMETLLREVERELDAYREKAERLSEQMREACEAVGPAWFVTAETTLAEAIQRKCAMLEKETSDV